MTVEQLTKALIDTIDLKGQSRLSNMPKHPEVFPGSKGVIVKYVTVDIDLHLGAGVETVELSTATPVLRHDHLRVRVRRIPTHKFLGFQSKSVGFYLWEAPDSGYVDIFPPSPFLNWGEFTPEKEQKLIEHMPTLLENLIQMIR